MIIIGGRGSAAVRGIYNVGINGKNLGKNKSDRISRGCIVL